MSDGPLVKFHPRTFAKLAELSPVALEQIEEHLIGILRDAPLFRPSLIAVGRKIRRTRIRRLHVAFKIIEHERGGSVDTENPLALVLMLKDAPKPSLAGGTGSVVTFLKRED